MILRLMKLRPHNLIFCGGGIKAIKCGEIHTPQRNWCWCWWKHNKKKENKIRSKRERKTQCCFPNANPICKNRKVNENNGNGGIGEQRKRAINLNENEEVFSSIMLAEWQAKKIINIQGWWRFKPAEMVTVMSRVKETGHFPAHESRLQYKTHDD